MNFFIKEENIRPGNRGGRDQFNWNDVRLMNNKDRESYLGVTQSIGFLDKGGKWRKRDWWQSSEHTKKLDLEGLKAEREKIKKEEEKMLRESLGGPKEKAQPPPARVEGGLTDYEWKELMKKEANFHKGDEKLNEFYEDDEHKAGLGMKTLISFKANPYEKSVINGLSKLEGYNINTLGGDKDLSKYLDDEDVIPNENQKDDKEKTIVNKYVSAYIKSKKGEVKDEIIKPDDGEKKHKDKTEKKHKDKTEKKHKDKSEKKRSRSKEKKKHKKSKKRSRSRERSHKH